MEITFPIVIEQDKISTDDMEKPSARLFIILCILGYILRLIQAYLVNLACGVIHISNKEGSSMSQDIRPKGYPVFNILELIFKFVLRFLD